jgi:lipopolysaccharide export system permease protein
MNLVLAVLIYMTYSNLISIVQGSIAQSRVPVAMGVAVHAGMLLLLVLLFYRRLMVVPLGRLLRPRART